MWMYGLTITCNRFSATGQSVNGCDGCDKCGQACRSERSVYAAEREIAERLEIRWKVSTLRTFPQRKRA